MDDERFEHIKSFLIEAEPFVVGKKLDRTTSLEGDLRIYGDDAIEFIVKFGKAFGVDVSLFEFDKYFSAEGWSLKEVLCGKEELFPLTLGDLERAVVAGRLDDSVIHGLTNGKMAAS